MGNRHIWILFLPSPSHHFNAVIEDDSAQCPPYSLLHHLRFSTPTLTPKNTEQQEAGSYRCHVTVSSHLRGHAQHGPTLPDTTSAHNDDNVLCVRMPLQWMWWGQCGKRHTPSSLPLPTVNASVIHCGYHPHIGATVDSLITHTPWWTALAMPYEGLCVMREPFWCEIGVW